MPLDPTDSSLYYLLCKIVVALVDRTEAVRITPTPQLEGVRFSVAVDNDDTGKLIGKHGHTAMSLRIIFSAIGMKMRRRYTVEIAD